MKKLFNWLLNVFVFFILFFIVSRYLFLFFHTDTSWFENPDDSTLLKSLVFFSITGFLLGSRAAFIWPKVWWQWGIALAAPVLWPLAITQGLSADENGFVPFFNFLTLASSVYLSACIGGLFGRTWSRKKLSDPGRADKARGHIQEILTASVQYSDHQRALVLFDQKSALSVTLAEAYRRCLPKSKFIRFDDISTEETLAELEPLQAGDLVVLIHSLSFRVEEFRILVELFNRSIKVIEHSHLGQMQGAEADYYIDSLAYDAPYYRGTGKALKGLLDKAKRAVIASGGERLIFESGFEPAALKIGDYTGMKNVGGQFPIGALFTQAKDLEAVNGRVKIFLFSDTWFLLNKPASPITLVVTKGRVTDLINATPEFKKVIAQIRGDAGEVWVRDVAFGLNRALTPQRLVRDIGTCKHMCGIHLSLGAKEAIFKKRNLKITERSHIDVFAVTDSVTLDDQLVYQSGGWNV